MARWIPVPEANSLEVDDSTTIIVNGTDVALCRDANGYYALSNRCPHRRGQIGDGRVANRRAWCPLHNWDFDLRTGISPYNPNDRLDTYPVAVNGSGVEIDADAVPVTPATGYLRDYQGRYRRFVDDVESEYDTDQHFARFGQGAVEAMRTARPVVGFDAVQFRPAQLATLPILDDEPITLGVTLGAKCNHPLTLSMPVLVSHMSFGALSKEAKIRARPRERQCRHRDLLGRGRHAARGARQRLAVHPGDGVGLLRLDGGEHPSRRRDRNQDRTSGEGRRWGAAARFQGHAGDRQGSRPGSWRNSPLPGPISQTSRILESSPSGSLRSGA